MKLTEKWRKSTRSGPYSDNCVEARWLDVDRVVEVRNSNQPDAGTARFTRAEWSAFTAGVKDNEFEV